jgi:hypothetical protein
MVWTVRMDAAFDPEFEVFDDDVQDALLVAVRLLEIYGPQLGRPYVDTLKGSKFSNMKELRFGAADGVWRVAFAFDPQRVAILLVAGDKSGIGARQFYGRLIDRADERYAAHLRRSWN